MKITKSAAFILGLIMIAGIGTLTFIKKEFPAGIFLTAVVSIMTAYNGIDVSNNWVKGSKFNPELHRAENPQLYKNEEAS